MENMDGIKISDQNLYGNEGVENTKNKVWSVFSSQGVHLDGGQNRLTGDSFINSYEVDFFPHDDGTRIHVKYGLSTLGIFLAIILLILGVVLGLILLIYWYIKMDEMKSSLSHAFPGFVPPQAPGTPDFNQQSGSEGQSDSDKIPPPPTN